LPDGKFFYFKAINLINSATIVTAGTDTIDFANSYSFVINGECIGMVKFGSNWYII